MTANKGPTLTDAKGMGGIIALGGFDYQVWDALARLPAWLRNPAFEGFAIEVLEDAEARFFAPQAPRGHVLDRFQAKSGVLDRAGLIDVFDSFRKFETAHPSVARVQTLVTTALPPKLTWLARDPGRVRRARPFYAPFADIRAASDGRLRNDLVAEFGSGLGDFFADTVEVSIWPVPDRSTAEAAFAAALHREFPDMDASARKLSSAFGALNDLAAQARGSMLTRSRLLNTLRDTLGVDLVTHRHILAVHVRSDRNGEAADALEIDASGFSGDGAGYPEPARWRAELLEPLAATAFWARKSDFSRIALSGSYRLSTGFAFGWTFRSAVGFEIEIPTKAGVWASDLQSVPNGLALPWSLKKPNALLHGDCLVVGIGVLRDPMPDILNSWALVDDGPVLLATLPQALTDGVQAQISVRTIKAAIVEAVARLRPARIDLCYAGPAALAVALGHRWNALPPTQLHEFVVSEGRYAPTAVLR